MKMLDVVFLELIKSGGISGFLIAAALIYLSLQVRELQKVVNGMRITIGEKVFPMMNEFEGRISRLEGRNVQSDSNAERRPT